MPIGCVGCFYISPGVLNRTSGKESRFNPRSFLPPPWLLNVLCIGFPLIVTVVIVSLGSLGGREYREFIFSFTLKKNWVGYLIRSSTSFSTGHAAQLWHSLDFELRSQSSTTPISAQQEASALQIWYTYSNSIWWITLGFICFCCFAFLLLIFYIIAAVFLISTLKQQISVTKTKLFGGGFRSLTGTSQMSDFMTTKDERAAAEEETR